MRIFVIALTCFVLSSCTRDKVYSPKPRMYPKIDFPVQEYKGFHYDACNFSFMMPAYSNVNTDVKFFNEEPKDPCWFDLQLPNFNGAIHFSYTSIDDKINTLDKLITDAFRIAEQHNVKAEYREEAIIENKNGVNGLMFNMEGPVASPVNFFLTDTLEHFVRASLYFNSEVNPDSIKPILEFVSKDIDKIIGTFEWVE